MKVPTIFKSCDPRSDVLSGAVTEADFAADLAQVVNGTGPDHYVDPAHFFANTYPTRGLKTLLASVCTRMSGAGGGAASIFRLDTSYGGGKSHGLIALCHAVRGNGDLPNISDFVNPALLPKGSVRIAAFDGENADPINGRRMDGGHRAFTPWGEIASQLADKEGYERVRESDEKRIAPGAETLRELFGGEPTLILLDELSIYLRKAGKTGHGLDQLTAFLTALFKAVESTPNAVLVFALAVGKDGRAQDAYRDENQSIADIMAELESVSARKATLLNPTEESETIEVLRRRLFERIDGAAADAAANAYRTVWRDHSDAFPEAAKRPEAIAALRSAYPFHPEVLETLTKKTATLGDFQRVRGMLRLLAHTVAHLWTEKPADATAIHLHHIDPGHEPIRQEIVTRLGQSAFVPAISNDVSAGPGGRPALAQEIDKAHHGGMPPFASYAARTIFMHTLAFNEALKGISPEQLRYSVSGPETDISFVEDARKKFITESAYLDDRPGAPMRFRAEANLTQMIRRTGDQIDAGEVRTELNDRIRGIFDGKLMNAVLFPGGPFDVADDVADGRPKLVVLGYDALTVGASVESVPDLIRRIYERKGTEGAALRALRNNLVFVVADEARMEDTRRLSRHRLALREMKRPERIGELAEHQQDQVRELEAKSEQHLAIAIQQCYRHVFYPSRNRIGTSEIDLAHTAIDVTSASDGPGSGQRQIVRTLRDLNKLRLAEDEPDSPVYVRDRTPLRNGQISTASLRNEFRRDPVLPILVDDDIFVRGVRRGIEQGEYVYQRGDLLFGPDDPPATIKIDEQSMIFTMAYARNKGIWPRPSAQPEEKNPGQQPGPTKGVEGNDPPNSGPDGPGEPGPDSFTEEGILREAFVRLWERVRAKKVEAIKNLTIRMFEAGDAFRLLGVIGSVSGTERTVNINGGYETRDGGSFELEFRGPVADAQPVREFLEPQLRDALKDTIQVEFNLVFEGGLSMNGDAAEKLTERLSRFASGATYVTATAVVKA